MKLEDILKVLGYISSALYIIINTIIIVKNNNDIEYLNNRLDSLTINNNDNYSYSHITTFENKTPEEGIDEALQYYGIKYPKIVKAQAILETGNFTSRLCIKNNNLFGLYDSENKRYYSYTTWYESIKAYKRLVQDRYNSNYYYKFLENIKYAEDKEYVNKLKEIVEELK